MTERKSAHFRVERCRRPYPGHYSRAFAFSAFLYPQHHRRSLRFACRLRQRYGLTLFRISFRASRTLLLRRQLIVHGGSAHKRPRLAAYLLVQACQHVWLVGDYGVYPKFTYVGRYRSSLAPHRLRAGRFHVASRLGVPGVRWLHCRRSFTPSRCQLRMSG
jgi:hypothetical protein